MTDGLDHGRMVDNQHRQALHTQIVLHNFDQHFTLMRRSFPVQHDTGYLLRGSA